MIATTLGKSIHERADILTRRFSWVTYKEDTEFTYTFENFFHPFVGELIQKLNKESLRGMLDPQFHKSLATQFFETFYKLQKNLVKVNYFPKEIDVREGGPYANYNWELLFHVPLTIAVHLSKNQRFAEAQRWFHFIFDPTSNDTSTPIPQRFWKFIAFQGDKEITQIDQLLTLLSKPADECTADELLLRENVLNGYEAIKNKPFQPHAVARTRHIAYQYSVVMKYLDNLIAWGDSLFRQDTIESINEATQRYILAANILGERPQIIPQAGSVRPKTFAELKKQGMDAMGNALVELESKFPFNLGLPKSSSTSDSSSSPLFGIGRTLYFCIPRNDYLLAYWDLVADRLYKIRNCMNIEGIVRQLALFDPPLDPGMLVKAAAAGIDIGSIINGLNQPIGPVRCLHFIQKALELTSEVKGLGGALLSAIEKRDSERLALLRQKHEITIQEITQDLRFIQWKQAQQSTETLLRSRAVALERYRYYQRLLGLTVDSSAAPDTLPLQRSEITEENFDEIYGSLVGQYDKSVPTQTLEKLKLADTSPSSESGASGQGKLYLNMNEDAELNKHLPAARDNRLAASVANVVSTVLTFIPEFNINLHFWGLGASSKVFGGSKLSDAAKIAAEILQTISSWEQDQAGLASRTAGFERRADDWILQNNLAARELMQIGRQIIGSLIAEQAAQKEYQLTKKQIEHSREVDQFLHDKFTNEDLYAWMQGEISRLFYEYYRFAFDTARKAERTMKQELMRSEVDSTDYIKFNYWDAGRRGLLSGDALYLDLKRMELAYHENNKREYELTRHVSLRQLAPEKLLLLKATGSCEVTLPEWLFDLNCPGHYMRRIKSVALSIPSVIGPYATIACTLTLLKSTIRKSALLTDDEYARQGSEDIRFVDSFGTIQSVVTSSGNNDAGLFETNLRDERFLPFEGSGVESTWKLELPKKFRQFDYNTISDVILHVRYTARQGGAQLQSKAVESLEALVADASTSALLLLLSLKHDFPGEWHQFVTGNTNFQATVSRDYFPYFTQGKDIAINGLKLLSIAQAGLQSSTPQGLDFVAMTASLADSKAFDLSLPPGGVFARQSQANTFLLIKYSLE